MDEPDEALRLAAERQRSSEIRSVVQDLKLGRISKAQMLERLHQLRTGAPEAAADATAEAAAAPPSPPPPNAPETTSPAFDANPNANPNRNPNPNPNPDPNPNPNADPNPNPDPNPDPNPNPNPDPTPDPNLNLAAPAPSPVDPGANAPATRTGPYADAAAPLGVVSGGLPSPLMGMVYGNATPASARSSADFELDMQGVYAFGQPPPPPPPPDDDRYYGSADLPDYSHPGRRSSQRASPRRTPPALHSYTRHSRVREEMMRECTFTPSVKELPQSYGKTPNRDREAPFHERMTAWKKEADYRVAKSKRSAYDAQMKQCTFSPSIDERSDRIARRMRTSSGTSYYDAPVPDQEPDAGSVGSPEVDAITDRLFGYSRTLQERRELREKQKKKQEDEIYKRTCSFQPRTTMSNKGQPAGSPIKTGPASPRDPVHERLLGVKENPRKKAATVREMFAECTFEPVTNRVPAHMQSAREYLKDDVINRLTSAPPPPPPPESDSGPAPAAAPQPEYDEWGEHNSNADTNTNAEASNADAVKKASFKEFLTRQGTRGSKQKKLVEKFWSDNKKHANSTFVAPGSKRILEQHRVSDTPFLMRMQAEQVRRQQVHDRKYVASREREVADCTFSPEINLKSQERMGRDAEMLSTVDAQKRATTVRLARMRKEADEAREMTFQPTMIARASRGKGRLNVGEDPERYMALQKEWERQKNDERSRRKAEDASREMQECSFSPATKKLPVFIQRMAVAHREAVRVKTLNSPEDRRRPDWR